MLNLPGVWTRAVVIVYEESFFVLSSDLSLELLAPPFVKMMNRNSRSKEEVGGIIKSILVAEKKSSTIGMPIVQLEEEYKAQDGMKIPYRALGYSCLMEFLESLQRKGEIVVGKRGSMHVVYPCVDEKIAHVSALVSGQKDSTKRCSRGGKRNISRSYPRIHHYQPPRLDSRTLTDVLKLIKRAPNGMHVCKIIEYLHDRNIFIVDENHLLRQLRDVSHEVSIENSIIYPIIKKQITPKNVNYTNGYAVEKDSAPAYKPAGYSDGEDDDETFEFAKKSDSVQSLPPENSNQLHEKSKATPLNIDENANTADREEENSRVDDNDDVGMLLNSRTRFRLEKLIQKYPSGIWCAELPNFYQMEYCIPLNYQDLGFGNVSDFAAHLPEIFHCVRLQDKGDFKLFDAKSPTPQTKQSPRPRLTLAALHNMYESYRDEVEPVPVLLSPTTSQRLVPEGVMTIGETVGQICVTQLFHDNTPHIDVVVVDAITPTFFWIQLLKKIQRFDRFMRDLHEFYSENASKYIIPTVLLERGLNCACIFDKKWHRGVIKTVQPKNGVTVMFYDYGTVLTYPPQDIHFLHRSFSNLPAQAIPCGLYNLKPKSTEKWPFRVCQVFAEQVLDVPMVAMLGSIDADNNSMLIALTNTAGTMDFHISDWMISSGFAVYGKMVCIRPPNYPFRHYLECKHGKSSSNKDTKKTTSNSGKIVNDFENNGAPQTSVANETVGNASFYETLLKLRRKPGKNSLEASSNSSNCKSRFRPEESRVFDAAALQPVVETTKIVVTENNTTNKSIVGQNLEQPFSSQNENYGTNFLKKLCVSYANQMTAMNSNSSSSSSGNVCNIIKPSNGLESGVSSSSASVILPICKNEKPEKNRVDESQRNLEVPLVPKRVAKLAKLVASCGFKPLIPSAKSNEKLSNEKNPAKPSSPTPLHLRPEIPERQNCNSEFGAIYSTLGGHGSMEPIDWNQFRNEGKSAVPDNFDNTFKEKPARIASMTALEKDGKSRHSCAFEKLEKLEKLEKNILPSNFSNTQFENSETPSKVTTRVVETKTNQPVNKITKNYREIDNNEEKSLPSRHRETYAIKRYFKMSVAEEIASKPREWNVPKSDTNAIKHHSEVADPKASESTNNDDGHNRESTKQAEKISIECHQEIRRNSEELISKPDAKVSSTLKTSPIAENSPSTNATSKLASKKVAFLNFVLNNIEKKKALPEFDDFHSIFGGNGRMEIIPWDKLRKLDSPEKIEPPKKVATKREKKTPVKLKHVEKGFSNIVNYGLPPPNEMESLCVPEGNIKQQAELSPTLRAILKSVNDYREDKQLRLFIPDDIAELLKNDDPASSSSSSRDSQADKSSAEDPREISGGCGIKSTVKYKSLGRNSLKRCSSSDTIPESTESEFSRANDNSSRDFDTTNDVSGIMSGSASKSGEKLLKSSDTSAIASPASPAVAPSTTHCVDASELIAVEKKSSSPKAEKIARENVRKRVNFDVESHLIGNFDIKEKLTKNRQLDSDDLSSDEEPNEKDSTNLVNQNTNQKASSKLANLAKIIHKSVNHEQASRTRLDSNDEQFSLHFDSSTKKLDADVADILEKEPRVPIERVDKDFGKAEKSLYLPRNAERSSLQLPKDDREFVPSYDDTCEVSDEEEWDFSSGFDLSHLDIENRRQLAIRSFCERIDEAPELEKTLTWKDSNSDNERMNDSRTDQNVEELSNATADVISNIHQVSTEKNTNVDGDKRSISTIETIEHNSNAAKNNETSPVSKKTSYSILSEVQKFNINATTEALARINSSSSSSSVDSSKDQSYTASLMSALKHYL